jgi:hypothetical protein
MEQRWRERRVFVGGLKSLESGKSKGAAKSGYYPFSAEMRFAVPFASMFVYLTVAVSTLWTGSD